MKTLLLLSVFVASALGGAVQKPGLQLPPTAAANREAVVQIFNISYSGYRCVDVFPGRRGLIHFCIGNLLSVMTISRLLVKHSQTDLMDGVRP